MSYPDGASVFHVNDDISVFPIRAATIPPFLHTNLVILRRSGTAVIVDPGGNDEEALARALATVKEKDVFVVITHKHRDHWESLKQVMSVFPSLTLVASRQCLDCIKMDWPKKLVVSMSAPTTMLLGLVLLPTPGHTDGDISVLDEKYGVCCVGDHCVGSGSSVLDGECGDMSEYLNTCRKLLDLKLKVLVPAHGPINHDPDTLLNTYITHRLEREKQILDCVKRGLITPQQIVEVVYATTPKNLWPAAMSNITLHLKRIKSSNL